MHAKDSTTGIWAMMPGRVMILVLLFLASISVHAQLYWEPANNGINGASTRAFGFSRNGEIYTAADNGVYRLIASQKRWEMVQPGMIVDAFLTTPAGTMLASGDDGVYRSEDNGNSWSRVSADSLHLDRLVASPNGSIFGIGGYTGNGGGFYRSTDEGKSWQRLSLQPKNMSLSRLVVNRAGELVATTFPGAYLSRDNGDSWITTVTTPSYVVVLAFTPNGQLISNEGSMIRRSTDYGKTWMDVDSFMVNSIATGLDRRLYVAGGPPTTSDTAQSGIFRIADDGSSLSRVSFTVPNTLAVAPDGRFWSNIASDGHFWNGIHGSIFSSTDSGTTWIDYGDGLSNTMIVSIVVDPSGRLFALESSGQLYRSTDNGGSWMRIRNGLVSSSNPFMVQANSAGLFAVVRRTVRLTDPFDSVFDYPIQSTDGGEQWRVIDSGISITGISSNDQGVAALGFARPFIRGGLVGGGVAISTDNGKTWTFRPDTGAFPAIRNVLVTPDATIFAGGYDTQDFGPYNCGLFRSTDRGATWKDLSELLTLSPTDCASIENLAVGDDGTIFAATASNSPKIYRSTDNGEHWNVVRDSTRADRFFFDSHGHLFIEAFVNRRLSLRSTDNGETWTTLDRAVRNLIVGGKGELYGLDSGKVYRSMDDGESWTDISVGIPASGALSLAVTPGGYLFAGTNSDGVYRTTAPASVPIIRHSASSLLLEPNTPNPFSGSTTIRFTLPGAQHITVSVHDLLGREVATLVDGLMPAGRNEVKWNAEGVASGAYVVTLAGESGNNTRVIVVQ